MNLEVVKLDLHVANQVVHQIGDVTHVWDLGSNTDVGLEANSGHPHTEESAQDVVTLSGQGVRSLASTKLSAGTNVTKGNRNMGEPIALLNRGNEPCDGVRATIHETLEFSKSGKVDEQYLCGHRGERHVTHYQHLKNSKK